MIDQDIKKFVLRRLLQKKEPASAVEIKLAIRSAFTAVFTEGELDGLICALADDNFITLGKDDFDAIVMDLTPKGRNAAQRLIKLS